MKYIILALLVIASGCSSPNPNPNATAAAYEQVKVGMSRQQVYALLGQPRSVQPEGDVDHCRKAVWGNPHDSHGWGHWTIKFTGDTVTDINTGAINATGTASGSASQ